MSKKKKKVTFSGVRLQQGRVQLDADFTESDAVSSRKPSTLAAQGYRIVEASIEPGGLALLMGKGSDLVLIRMQQLREGGGTDSLVVNFAAKVP